MNLKQLGSKGGFIYISREKAGMLESNKLKYTFQAEQTNSLKTSQIKVVNNKNKSDSILVTGLTKGDNVVVYSSANKKFASIKASSSTATLSVKQLGTKTGDICVSVMREGLKESTKVKMTFSAEQSNALKTSQIKTVNNKGKSDLIEVTGIEKGDTIIVYNSANKQMASTKATSTKAKLSLKQLSSKSGYIWVSVKKADLAESAKIKVSYRAE